jgi:hypothetical protein
MSADLRATAASRFAGIAGLTYELRTMANVPTSLSCDGNDRCDRSPLTGRVARARAMAITAGEQQQLSLHR